MSSIISDIVPKENTPRHIEKLVENEDRIENLENHSEYISMLSLYSH